MKKDSKNIKFNFLTGDAKKIFIFLLSQHPEKSDVVVWLQGDRYDRSGKVVELFKKGFAPKVLISGNNIRIGKHGETDAFYDTKLDEIKNFLLENGVKGKDILVDDDSLNTAQHPENICKIANEQGWKKIILVSSPYHQLRVFLTFVKYFNNNNLNVKMINQPALDLPWNGVAGGKTKTRIQLFIDELAKIKKYKNDLASYKEAKEYINSHYL